MTATLFDSRGSLKGAHPPHAHTGPSYYFTEFTFSKGLLYGTAAVFVFATSVVAILEPYISLPCNLTSKIEFENPGYDDNPCRHIRFARLLWLTAEECSFGRRLLASVVLGGIIGWERREADRPAGIRTMSLVALGSCLFTINSAFAFVNGPMNWDASRVAAAIPSGVGFLGAGLIFKKEDKNEQGESQHVVTGLTTAASVWISAAVGIACGGDLYFAAAFCTAAMMLLLRFGPRLHDLQDEESDEEEEEEGDTYPSNYSSTVSPMKKDKLTGLETEGLISSASKRMKSDRSKEGMRRSNRSRAALSTMV